MGQNISTLSHGRDRISGVLLAAGQGKRFDPSGKRHKLLAHLPQGQTVIRTSVLNMLPWVDDLMVVVGTHNAGIARELAGLPVRIIVCAQAWQGPGASLRCGLTQITDETGGCLIALADMPWIGASTYKQVRLALQAGLVCDKNLVWRACHLGQPGHPVALTTAMARRYLDQDLPLNVGLSALWQQDRTCLQAVDVNDPGCVFDIDHAQDLAQRPS